MQSDAMMDEAARAQTSAAAERCPPGCANGVRSRARPPRRRSGRTLGAGAHAVVALLLLLLLPLGLAHRSSTGACRHDHRVAVTAGAWHDAGADAPAAAPAGHERMAVGEQHEHPGGALPLDGAAPSACGPAILTEPAIAAGAAPYRALLPDWRALSPFALAPPPPAPPPRLS